MPLSPFHIAAAQSAESAFGIPASVTLAQGIIESAWFTRQSGKFNYFGIKARPNQSATTCWTHEVINGRTITIRQDFANYPNPTVGFSAHAKLLATSPIYARARAVLPNPFAFVRLLGPRSEGGCGYATAPHYGDILAKVIRTYKLTQYDKAPVHENPQPSHVSQPSPVQTPSSPILPASSHR
jgi:flagellum-specific peptidoglycan hydrolase FlgJ